MKLVVIHILLLIPFARGGTFTLEQLIIEFKRFEKQSIIDNLRKDAIFLNEVLLKEDWEIKQSILDYLLKKGNKNKMKRIINCLIERL